MKRLATILFIGLAILSVAGLALVSACSQPSPTTTKPAVTTSPAATKPATTAPPTSAAAPLFTLKYGIHSAPPPPQDNLKAAGNLNSAASDWYLTEVEKRTNGRVKITRYWSGALAPAEQLLAAIKSGAADMGTVTADYQPALMPMENMGTEPMLFDDLYSALAAYGDLFRSEPVLQDELAKQNSVFLAPAGSSHYGIISRVPIKSLADVKGLKIRTQGDVGVLLKAMGAAAVSMTGPELFDAMNKGTVDGVCIGPTGTTGYNLQNAGKYYWDSRLAGQLTTIAINMDVWKKMPKDIQDIMVQIGKEHPVHHTEIYHVLGDSLATQKMLDAGVQITKISQADKDTAIKMAKEQVWLAFQQKLEAQGIPAKRIMDKYLELYAQYYATSKYKD